MSFKKYTDMELALLSAIANLTAEDVEDIEMEKGDIASVSIEECFVPSYLSKPNAKAHAMRRKNTFHKKEERKNLAHSLGYIVETNNSKKVDSMLAASHADNAYFRGRKTESKYMTVQKEMDLMEQEAFEIARDSMEKEHDGILGAIACDIDTLTLDMRDNEYSIERLEEEYEALREEMELVAEKLQNAKLRRNGIQAALVQNKSDFATLSADFEKERIRRFGW